MVRATQDVELLIVWPLSRAPLLVETFKSAGRGATFHKGGLDDPLPGVIGILVPTSETPARCDLIFAARAFPPRAVAGAEPVELDGVAVRLVRAADLFLLQLHAGGPTDLLDAAQLDALQTEAVKESWRQSAARIRNRDAFARCLRFLR